MCNHAMIRGNEYMVCNKCGLVLSKIYNQASYHKDDLKHHEKMKGTKRSHFKSISPKFHRLNRLDYPKRYDQAKTKIYYKLKRKLQYFEFSKYLKGEIINFYLQMRENNDVPLSKTHLIPLIFAIEYICKREKYFMKLSEICKRLNYDLSSYTRNRCRQVRLAKKAFLKVKNDTLQVKFKDLYLSKCFKLLDLFKYTWQLHMLIIKTLEKAQQSFIFNTRSAYSVVPGFIYYFICKKERSNVGMNKMKIIKSLKDIFGSSTQSIYEIKQILEK